MSDEQPEQNIIASRLRTARESAGLSQGQVARLVGLHRPSISELEAGRRRVTAAELAKFAEIYDVPLPWLVGETVKAADTRRDQLELAARELAKLKPEDFERLMKLLTSLRQQEG